MASTRARTALASDTGSLDVRMATNIPRELPRGPAFAESTLVRALPRRGRRYGRRDHAYHCGPLRLRRFRITHEIDADTLRNGFRPGQTLAANFASTRTTRVEDAVSPSENVRPAIKGVFIVSK